MHSVVYIVVVCYLTCKGDLDTLKAVAHSLGSAHLTCGSPLGFPADILDMRMVCDASCVLGSVKMDLDALESLSLTCCAGYCAIALPG